MMVDETEFDVMDAEELYRDDDDEESLEEPTKPISDAINKDVMLKIKRDYEMITDLCPYTGMCLVVKLLEIHLPDQGFIEIEDVAKINNFIREKNDD